MDAVAALTRLGGIATAADLLVLTSRKRLRRAVAKRQVVHISRNRYALRSADQARSVAVDVDGHLRLLSACAHWGWETKWPARVPQILVADKPTDSVAAELTCDVVPRRDLDGWATSRLRTVLDCAGELPFDEALAVADSALRHDLTHDQLASALTPQTADRVRRVVEHASPLAANPFESVLRAILVEAGMAVVLQWAITLGGVTYHPDLAEPFHGIAIEADSWTHHASHADHTRDCRRYNALVVSGWVVLRFTWEQVMFEPHQVVATVRSALALSAAA